MHIVALDFETYYDKEYTLKKLSTEAYIRDPRFQVLGCAIKWSANHDAKWYAGPELARTFEQEDWSQVMLICHHAYFDGLILSHHYGVVPGKYACTLSMSRLLLGNHVKVSLDSVRSRFGIPAKTTPYNLFVGKRFEQLDPSTLRVIADGCCDEVESIWTIFSKLLTGNY